MLTMITTTTAIITIIMIIIMIIIIIIIIIIIPTDRNISSKEFDKLSKNKDLETEIQKMWKLRASTVPVIVGALGMIKKGTEHHISTIPGDSSLQEIQKIVLLGTAHILRGALSM